MSLTPYQLAFSTCFVFWRENCRLTVLDQHNLPQADIKLFDHLVGAGE